MQLYAPCFLRDFGSARVVRYEPTAELLSETENSSNADIQSLAVYFSEHPEPVQEQKLRAVMGTGLDLAALLRRGYVKRTETFLPAASEKTDFVYFLTDGERLLFQVAYVLSPDLYGVRLFPFYRIQNVPV